MESSACSCIGCKQRLTYERDPRSIFTHKDEWKIRYLAELRTDSVEIHLLKEVPENVKSFTFNNDVIIMAHVKRDVALSDARRLKRMENLANLAVSYEGTDTIEQCNEEIQ